MGGNPSPEPVLSDIPLIQCAVCKATVRRAYHVVKELHSRFKVGRPTEEQILTAISPICDPGVTPGEWLSWYDMQEQPDRTVALKRMPVRGECGTECMTASAACQHVLDAVDAELAEALFRGDSTSKELEAKICGSRDGAKGATYELRGACSRNVEYAPEERPEGPQFIRATTVRAVAPESTPKSKDKKKRRKRTSKNKQKLEL